MNFEELNTVNVEIEKCVNSRPLAYLSEEHKDTVITPNRFIYGRDIDGSESVQQEFHELTGNDMKNGKLVVKLHLNILRNDLLKNIC